MTVEDPPHESPRPPTLEASHPLTGWLRVFRLAPDDPPPRTFASMLERATARSRAAQDFKPIGYAPAPAQGDGEHS